MEHPLDQLPPLDPRQRYTISQTNKYLRQSNAKTYLDIKAGMLRTIKDGKRRYVPGTEILRRSSLTERDAVDGAA